MRAREGWVVLIGIGSMVASAGGACSESSASGDESGDEAGQTSAGAGAESGSSGNTSGGSGAGAGVSAGGASGATGGSGGTDSNGGVSGDAGSAGTPDTGGTDGMGGASGNGGDGNRGGAAPAGAGGTNAAGAGGHGGSGGATVACDTFWSVGNDGFVRSPGTSGCWHGYSWTNSGGAGSSILPMNFLSCGAACLLCADGTVGAGDSGLAQIGFNLNEQPGMPTRGTIAPTGSGLIVNFTKNGSFPLRVQIEGVANERWCVEVTASAGPVSIPWSSFNTECWAGGAGSFYAKQPLGALSLLIPGSTTVARAFSMCLIGAQDN